MQNPEGRALSIQAGAEVRGSVQIPPSKSVTNRALNLALLARGTTEIVRPLVSEDTTALIAAIEATGRAVDRASETVAVGPRQHSVDGLIECGASGTMMRFLTASFTTVPGTWTLDGTERLRQRPLGPLLGALRELGARIECLATEGFAPLRIEGGSLHGGEATLDAGSSSQFLSALLMAGTRAREPVSIKVIDLVSAPYVELTLQVMADFGLRVDRVGAGFTVSPQPISERRFEVEGDYSSACYFAAAAALTGGSVSLIGLRRDSAQGDARFLAVLERLGAECRWSGGDLTVTGSARLRAVEESLADMPDQVPTLAVLAPFATGTTVITDVGHLRLKESDRLRVVAKELDRCGVRGVVEESDVLTIPGVWSGATPAPHPITPITPVTIDTVDDHRIAMSFAVLGLRRSGISIAHPEVVAKSYPGFWEDFLELCGLQSRLLVP